jgi:hypothetical protein
LGSPQSSSTSTQTAARTGSGSATGSSFFDHFSQQLGSTPTSGHNPGSNTDIGRMLSEAVRAGASGAGTGGEASPVLTPEMVARAMRTALNTLSPQVNLFLL